MSIFDKDCLGRVPASIREIDECAMCKNYEICRSLWGAPVGVSAPNAVGSDNPDQKLGRSRNHEGIDK